MGLSESGKVNLSDPVYTLFYVFRDGAAPACLDAADSNDDGTVDLADGVYSLQYLFTSGPGIPAPFTECGEDASDDGARRVAVAQAGDGLPHRLFEITEVPRGTPNGERHGVR